MHAPPTRGSRASRSAQTRCGQPLRPVRGAWCGPAKPRTPDASIRTDGANAALTSRAAPADAPVTDLDSAHARTQATAPARLAGRSHARSQALGNGCAAARGSMCSHVTFVQAPPARRTLQQLERGRRLTHHAVDPVDRGPAPRLGRAARAAEQPRGREEGTRRRQLRRRPLKRRVAEQRRSSVAAPDTRHARTKATCCAILLCSGFFVVAGAARRHRRQLETCASRKPQETASRASYGYSITPLGSRCPLLAS